ncbi:MAG: class I SAM-dependent methyltransferase [Actinomycetota bacterium]|nr:class I SAM-dependent methyltransferase [Actinomycetota bacterium]
MAGILNHFPPMNGRVMASLTIQTKRLSIKADVPPRLASGLRRLRNGHLRSARPEQDGTKLEFGPTPVLRLARREVEATVDLFRVVRPPDSSPGGESGAGAPTLADRVSSLWWYHTIELPEGVVTPGSYDHRRLVPHYGIPEDLTGKRVLDVATLDGFWAFEFERRGAEVVGVDVARIQDHDLPVPIREAMIREGIDRATGEGFELAHQALGSRVKRVEASVYDLDPTRVGKFDLVHLADLLLHLENPLAALRKVRGVTRESALIVDCFDPTIDSGLSQYLGGWSAVTWWRPSLETLAQMIIDSGFSEVKVNRIYRLGSRHAPGPWRASLLASV